MGSILTIKVINLKRFRLFTFWSFIRLLCLYTSHPWLRSPLEFHQGLLSLIVDWGDSWSLITDLEVSLTLTRGFGVSRYIFTDSRVSLGVTTDQGVFLCLMPDLGVPWGLTKDLGISSGLTIGLGVSWDLTTDWKVSVGHAMVLTGLKLPKVF